MNNTTADEPNVVVLVVNLLTDGPQHVTASVSYAPSTGAYRLDWTDNVANDWAESYPQLDQALLRLAVLESAVRQDRLFQREVADFQIAADRFIEHELQALPPNKR